jgi:hypothetical protein
MLISIFRPGAADKPVNRWFAGDPPDSSRGLPKAKKRPVDFSSQYE